PFFYVTLPPPISTPFPYTTLFRSVSPPREHGEGRRFAVEDARRPERKRWPAAHRSDAVRPDQQADHGYRRPARGREEGPASVHEIGKSTRLNSSHDQISYAVFCLK